jgi:hypothetical protein
MGMSSSCSGSLTGTVPLLFIVSTALLLVRARLLGGTVESTELLVACFLRRRLCVGASSASSSPEASREDGWRRSVVERAPSPAVRLRFADEVDDGEDMAARRIARVRSSSGDSS